MLDGRSFINPAVNVFGKDTYMYYAMRDCEAAITLELSDNYEQSMILYQQAVEKAFKYVLVEKGLETEELLESHSLLKLAEAINFNMDEDTENMLSFLSSSYISLRYPTKNDPPMIDSSILNKFKSFTEKILKDLTGVDRIWDIPISLTEKNISRFIRFDKLTHSAIIETSVVINGKSYTPISIEPFAGLGLPNPESIPAIVIPGTVKQVGEGAFRCLSNLVEVVFQPGVKIIGNNVLDSCRLRYIYVPKSVEHIGKNFVSPIWTGKYGNLTIAFGGKEVNPIDSIEDLLDGCVPPWYYKKKVNIWYNCEFDEMRSKQYWDWANTGLYFTPNWLDILGISKKEFENLMKEYHKDCYDKIHGVYKSGSFETDEVSVAVKRHLFRLSADEKQTGLDMSKYPVPQWYAIPSFDRCKPNYLVIDKYSSILGYDSLKSMYLSFSAY